MIIRGHEKRYRELRKCHNGIGSVLCKELLSDYEKIDCGFKFIHDNIINPGNSVGEHTHRGDEEIYIIISGAGEMCIDGKIYKVYPGDVCVTRDGHTHSLTNTGREDMRFIVICCNLMIN